MAKISIIIPCFNEANHLGGQLAALANQCWSEPWEVIICDNGSTDQSMAVARRYRERMPKLCIVDASDQRGQAHARNIGAQMAQGD
jgi:glycosyltransferase involved in cell wall biosynthesis